MSSPVANIIDRLKADGTVPLSLVEGAAELASLGTGRPLAMPAAYVFVSEEAAAENERMTGVLQRVEMDLAVVLVVENLSDAQGAAASLDVETLRQRVRAALVGWQPPSAEDVVTYVGGRLVRAREGLVWWELTFATAIYQEG